MIKLPSFKTIIAEPPYDQMGKEFSDIFGEWLDETTLENDPTFQVLAFGLFRKRLTLAEKFNTFFAKQVTEGGKRNAWYDRFAGIGNDPCYSFAMPQLQRTYRFYVWCQMMEDSEKSNGIRYRDTNYAEYPELPLGPHVVNGPMEVWAHRYEPRFTAKSGGAFECRRMRYNDKIVLFEHPRNNEVISFIKETICWWKFSLKSDISMCERVRALASFEFLWFWANPFIRGGAITGDSMSLIVQKHIGVHIRNNFYHQDCEALLLPYEEYVSKRENDMLHGFVKRFPM